MVNRMRTFLTFSGIMGGLVVWGFFLFSLTAPKVESNTLLIPNTFSVGQIADPAAVNANFDAIKSIVNGQIDNDNWDTAGPDLSCSNLDLTSACATSTFIVDGTIATADIAANAVTASFTLASPSDIASATICGASGAFSDVTGASWSVTGVGGTAFAFFHATESADICTGGASLVTFRWMINGVAYNSMVQDESGSPGTIDLFGVGATSSGATTIKIQCSCSSTVSGTGGLTNMRAAAFELKR